MSHHFQLSPEIDLAIRSWIRRHERALRLGCFGSILMAFLLLIGLVWAAVWGAFYLTDRVPRTQKGSGRQRRVQIF